MARSSGGWVKVILTVDCLGDLLTYISQTSCVRCLLLWGQVDTDPQVVDPSHLWFRNWYHFLTYLLICLFSFFFLLVKNVYLFPKCHSIIVHRVGRLRFSHCVSKKTNAPKSERREARRPGNTRCPRRNLWRIQSNNSLGDGSQVSLPNSMTYWPSCVYTLTLQDTGRAFDSFVHQPCVHGGSSASASVVNHWVCVVLFSNVTHTPHTDMMTWRFNGIKTCIMPSSSSPICQQCRMPTGEKRTALDLSEGERHATARILQVTL